MTLLGLGKKETTETPVSPSAAAGADVDVKQVVVARLHERRSDLSTGLAKADPRDRHEFREKLLDLDVEISGAEAALREAKTKAQHELVLDDEAALRAHSHAFDERAGKAGIKAVADLVTAVRSMSEAAALRDYALQLRRAIGVYTVPPQAVESLHFRAMEKLDYGSAVVHWDEIHWPTVSVTLDRVEVSEAIAERMRDRSGFINPDDVAKHAAVNAELAARK